MNDKDTAAYDKAPDPDRRRMTALQARRLGAMSGLAVKEVEGLTVADLADKYRWRIDPELLFFRKICGRVVKKDAASGAEYPVPFATVHVEDTDCNLLGYFPHGWTWGWYFPLSCHREVLATVKTDECGRFCVYIPRFEIDWILRWRRERICFNDIFVRPSLADLLDIPKFGPIVDGPFDPPGPIPEPDPQPWRKLAQLDLTRVELLAGRAGRQVARKAADLLASSNFGARISGPDPRNVRAFDGNLPPPLPKDISAVLAGAGNVIGARDVKGLEAVHGNIAHRLGTDPRELKELRLERYIGPFRRCRDIIVPEWQVIVDVPDISFRVTQDTNGDGVEETIYSEGWFDVRWDATSIPEVTLTANDAARESRVCDTPPVPCKDTPELLFAGLMPLTDPAYFDAASGYALRPNRPKPVRDPAQTPFTGVLQLYGCVNVPNAAYYRVVAQLDGSGNFSPITGLSWNIYPLPSGSPHLVTADSDGWYPVLPNPGGFHPANMVLEWPTPALARMGLKVQLANAAKVPLAVESPVVAVECDNTAPSVTFTKLAWKFSSDDDSHFNDVGHNLLVTCPTIRRGASPRAIEIQFEAQVHANHLRDAALGSYGCGGGAFVRTTPEAAASHWHSNPGDNAVLLSGRYQLAAGAAEGAYSFYCYAGSRAMNPAGSDSGHLSDWFYDPLYNYVQPTVNLAIVNA
jgi:hypothetical protein